MHPLTMLLALHLLCDYPLQGDFLARAKNPAAPLPGVPWTLALTSHAFIHAAAVGLILPSFVLAEFLAHWAIDFAKCASWFGNDARRAFWLDQALHVACKVCWCLAAGVL